MVILDPLTGNCIVWFASVVVQVVMKLSPEDWAAMAKAVSLRVRKAVALKVVKVALKVVKAVAVGEGGPRPCWLYARTLYV